jgi:hypothetical protein
LTPTEALQLAAGAGDSRPEIDNHAPSDLARKPFWMDFRRAWLCCSRIHLSRSTEKTAKLTEFSSTGIPENPELS